MTTALPSSGPNSLKPAPPIVVVEQPVVVTDQATVDTELECPALDDAVVQEILKRAANYQENQVAMITWEELKAQLRAGR